VELSGEVAYPQRAIGLALDIGNDLGACRRHQSPEWGQEGEVDL
jgi:hypothetical protein